MNLHKVSCVIAFSLVATFDVLAQSSTTIVTNPSSTQTIYQPSGTTLTVVGQTSFGEATAGMATIDAYGNSAYFGINDPTKGISVNAWGNIGIGTPWAFGELSIVDSAYQSEVGEHIWNTDSTGYSVLRLGQDAATATGFAFHQFNSNWPGGSDTAFSPGSSSLAAFESGGLILDTFISSPIRFFTSGTSAANERMRIDPSGNVGIGTPTPSSTLEVHGNLTLSGDENGIIFPDGSIQRRAASGSSAAVTTNTLAVGTGAVFQVNSSGIVEQGALQYGNVLFPGTGYDGLDVTNTGTNGTGTIRLYGNGTAGSSLELYNNLTSQSNLSRMRIDANGVHANAYTFVSEAAGGQSVDPIFFRMAAADVLTIMPTGNVGIGTSTPGSDLVVPNVAVAPNAGTPILEVNGNIALTYHQGGAIYFQDGTVQSTAYLGVHGGDYAESVDVAGKPSAYEPGDVMILCVEGGSDVAKSSEAYSTLVAGIYSTRPGYVGRRQTTDSKLTTSEIPMAMVGIVPTKVSSENGPIHRGDLLVTSSVPGYAMRGTDRSRMIGAVLGKAMGSLESGMGVIEVLVTLE